MAREPRIFVRHPRPVEPGAPLPPPADDVVTEEIALPAGAKLRPLEREETTDETSGDFTIADAADRVVPVEQPPFNETFVRSEAACHFLAMAREGIAIPNSPEDFLEEWRGFADDPAVQQRWDVKNVTSALALVEGLSLRQKTRDAAPLAEAQRVLAEIRSGLQRAVWEKQMQNRYGGVPKEFELAGPAGKVTPEILRQVYEVADLPAGGVQAVEHDDLVGVQIVLPGDAQRTGEATMIYHRFTKSEREQLQQATREQPLTIGRPARYVENHIALQRDDVTSGDLLGVSLKHLKFYQDRGQVVAIDSSSNHGAALVRRARSAEEKAGERGVEWLERELQPDLVVDLTAVPGISESTRLNMAHALSGTVESDAMIPRRVAEFSKWLSAGEPLVRPTRAQLREAIFRLEGHAFSPVATPQELAQAKGRRDELVHGLEIAVNPEMARARVSAERRSAWQEAAAAGGQRLSELRRSLAEYRRLADKIDAAKDWRRLKLDNEIEVTGDQGFRKAYDTVERRIEDIGLGQDQRAQLLEAYRRWLRDAIETLEDLGVS
jgi:hypothetical protein